MPDHLLVVFTNAADGREEEFNQWYGDRHLDDVLRMEGVVAAQRFRLTPTEPAQDAPFRYLALYEVSAGQLDAARTALAIARATGAPVMPISDALADTRWAWWYDAIGERRVAGSAPSPEGP